MNKLAVKRLVGLSLGLYAAALLAGTHIPVSELPPAPTNDKLLHFGAYFGLAVFSGMWLSARGLWRPRTIMLCALFLALFGAVDELTQPFFRRTAEWADWRADLAGVTFGLIFWGVLVAVFRGFYSVSETESETQVNLSP